MNKHIRKEKPRSTNVVQAIFASGITLSQYIPSNLLCPGDSQKYINFCNTTYVIPPAHDKENNRIATLLQELSERTTATTTATNLNQGQQRNGLQVSFKDILHGFIADIIRKYPKGYQLKHDQNVLALGYRSKRHNSDLGMRNNADIECFAVNTVHLLFAGECWKTATARLGESIMRHLLGCAMFMLTDNGSYIQLSGVASSELLCANYLSQANPYGLGSSIGAIGGPTGLAASSSENVDATVVASPTAGAATSPLPTTTNVLSALLKELSARLIPRYMMFYGDERHSCNITTKSSGVAASSAIIKPSDNVTPQSIRSCYYLKPNHKITAMNCPLLFKSSVSVGSAVGDRRTYYDHIFIHPLLSQSKAETALAVDLYRQVFLASTAQFPVSLTAELAIKNATNSSTSGIYDINGRTLRSGCTVDQSLLLKLCQGILQGYRSCNVSLLLSLYCKERCPAGEVSPAAPGKVRGGGGKGRRQLKGHVRGKRGGRHVRQRMLFQQYLSSQLQCTQQERSENHLRAKKQPEANAEAEIDIEPETQTQTQTETQCSLLSSAEDAQVPMLWSGESDCNPASDDSNCIYKDDSEYGKRKERMMHESETGGAGATVVRSPVCISLSLPPPFEPSFDFYSLLDSVSGSEATFCPFQSHVSGASQASVPINPGNLSGNAIVGGLCTNVNAAALSSTGIVRVTDGPSSIQAPSKRKRRKRAAANVKSTNVGTAVASCTVSKRASVTHPTAFLTTIGERLYKRVSRCCRRDQRCSAGGYITQEENNEQEDEGEYGQLNEVAVLSDLCTEGKQPLEKTVYSDRNSNALLNGLDHYVAAYFASASYQRLLRPLSKHLPPARFVVETSTKAVADVQPAATAVVETVDAVADVDTDIDTDAGAGSDSCSSQNVSEFGFTEHHSSVHKRSRSLQAPSASALYDVTHKTSSASGMSCYPVTSAGASRLESDTAIGFHLKMDSVHLAATAATPASSYEYQCSGTGDKSCGSSGDSSSGGVGCSSSSYRPPGRPTEGGSQNTPLHGMFSDSWLHHKLHGSGSQSQAQSQSAFHYNQTPNTAAGGTVAGAAPTSSPTTIHGMACPVESVSMFVTAVCRRVFPAASVWGSARNQNHFLGFIVEYIGLGRYENRCVRQLQEKLRMNDIPWLLHYKCTGSSGACKDKNGASASKKKRKRGMSDSVGCKDDTETDALFTGADGRESTAAGRLHQVNSVLLSVFLHWVFTSVVNPLLSTTFYITEGEGLGASVLYYLKSIWTAIIAEVGVKQIRNHFMEISVPTAAEVSVPAAASTVGLGVAGRTSLLAPTASIASGSRRLPPVPRMTGGPILAAAAAVVSKNYGANGSGKGTDSIASAGKAINAGALTALCDANASSLPCIRFVPKKNTIRPIVNMKYNSGGNTWAARTKPPTGTVTVKANAAAVTHKVGGIGMIKTNSTGSTSGSTGGNSCAMTKPPSHFVGGVNTWGTVGGGTVMTNGALYQAMHLLKHLVENSGKNYFLPEAHAHLFLRQQQRQQQQQQQHRQQRLVSTPSYFAPPCSPAAGFSSIKGFGCLGMDEAYIKFKQYKQHILRNFMETNDVAEANPDACSRASVNYPKFYVAALDLEKCYDNIDTTRLYDIVKDLEIGGVSCCSDNEDDEKESEQQSLLLLKYTVTQYIESMERPITKRLRFVVDEGDIAPFPSVAKALAYKYHNSILTDGVIYPNLSVLELRRLMKHHLFNHVVQLPKFPVNVAGTTGMCASANIDTNTIDMNGSRAGLGQGGVFTQIKGIPQGSILSPLLCKVYYDFVETRVFGHPTELELLGLTPTPCTPAAPGPSAVSFSTPTSSRDSSSFSATTSGASTVVPGLGKTCIIRMVDDYLIVSTEQSCVQHFLQKVHTAYAPYGGGVNPLKTRVNFDSVIEINGEKMKLHNICDDAMSTGFPFSGGYQSSNCSSDASNNQNGGRTGVPYHHWLSWCGYYINTRTLEVAPNFSRILDLPIQHSVTVEYNKSVGLGLRKAMKTYVKAKCHGILLDSTINSLPTVENNVYEIFRVAALRSAYYIKKLLAGVSGATSASVLNSQYIVHCILEAVLYGARLLHTRTVRNIHTTTTTTSTTTDICSDDSNEPVAMSPLDVLLSNAERAASLPQHVQTSSRGFRGSHGHKHYNGVESNNSRVGHCGANDDLNSRGICLISVNDAIHLGMCAYVHVFADVQSNGLFSQIIKILTARMNNRAGVKVTKK